MVYLDRVASLRERLGQKQRALEKLAGAYERLMAMNDMELRIYNANQRGVLEADQVYSGSHDFGVLRKIESRTLPESVYLDEKAAQQFTRFFADMLPVPVVQPASQPVIAGNGAAYKGKASRNGTYRSPNSYLIIASDSSVHTNWDSAVAAGQAQLDNCGRFR